MTDKRFIRSRWFEDIPIGEFHLLGSHTFSEKETIEFGQKYVLGTHHAEPEMARETLHRGLVVSEWQIAAIWMNLMVGYMERFAAGVQDGRRNGVGVSLQDMQWAQAVRPGHTLVYTYEIIAKPDHAIRKKWGVIRSRNEAFNQNNDCVFSFVADILAERNPKQLSAKNYDVD